MVRDITIGQYYNVDSVIHQLDPRVKITFTLIYVISLFFARNPFIYAAAFLVLGAYIKASKVPLGFILKGLKAVWMVIFFTMLVHLFTANGIEMIFEWRFIRITKNGLYSAVYMALRLVFMIIGSGMLTYTTAPTALTDGLEKMLGWLEKLKVPVQEIAMIMSLALRFVPVLIEELDKIMRAQTARGIDFHEGNLFRRLRKLLSVIVPLFVSAVRRSNELAIAMDARCYHGGEGRTRMKPLQYRKRDVIGYVFVILYLAGMIGLAVKF